METKWKRQFICRKYYKKNRTKNYKLMIVMMNSLQSEMIKL